MVEEPHHEVACAEQADPCRCTFLPVATRWLTAEDDLTGVLREHLPPLRDDDTVVLSEKVAVLLTSRTVPADQYPAGRPARVLIRFVRPRPGSRGLSVPEKMQYVISTVGLPRVLAATAASALTRPFGWRGVFYRVAGPVARDLDGGRPPYEHLLFPPIDPGPAHDLVQELEHALGVGVAIVDLNDFGGTIRATSARSLPAERLLVALRGNPLGQRSTGTPFGVVRRDPEGAPCA